MVISTVQQEGAAKSASERKKRAAICQLKARCVIRTVPPPPQPEPGEKTLTEERVSAKDERVSTKSYLKEGRNGRTERSDEHFNKWRIKDTEEPSFKYHRQASSKT